MGIVHMMISDLQWRGLFRGEYEGSTSRDSLGSPVVIDRCR
jgi:hypothetical protein